MRTREQMYEPNSLQAAYLMRRCCPKIATTLMDWLEMKVQRHETLSVYQWMDDRFYIEVKDSTIPKEATPANYPVGFTVDVRRDEILWCKEEEVRMGSGYYQRMSVGGNCFVRSRRWKNLVSRQFAPYDKDGHMHQYTPYKPEHS